MKEKSFPHRKRNEAIALSIANVRMKCYRKLKVDAGLSKIIAESSKNTNLYI